MNQSWTKEHAQVLYHIDYWGDDYFAINDHGHLIVRPNRTAGPSIDLYELINSLHATGLSLPVLVRFSDILRNRVQRLIEAFNSARAESEYRGQYTAVYPIKVNQQRHVVEQIIAANTAIGLEAGTKPELMAILALSRPGGIIICNGYKDREYVRLALLAPRLGLRATIVIEKPAELDIILAEAQALGIKPRLGVRVRLSSIGAGKWQNSGGIRAKFGLDAAQLLELINRLKETGLIDSLELMHFHLGSQVANIRDIQNGLREAARYYAALRHLGVPLTTVDVGGGLGVDYDGTASRGFCSINYSLQEYANDVVHAFASLCAHEGLPHPDLITESGRAMTAHHAVLLTHVVDLEHTPECPLSPPTPDAPPLIRHLWEGLSTVDAHNALEVYHDAVHWRAEAQSSFDYGLIDLAQRAIVEQLYNATCARVYALLRADARRNREIRDDLNEQHADKYFCNFSVFQSIPDSWAIKQIFPVVPIHRLNDPPTRSAVIEDLTCDSDGRINLYVESTGVETTLPLHDWQPEQPYFLGMFLVGAYQETLGDLHNLFGDTHAVNVELTDTGWRIFDLIPGDTVSDVLHYVHFDPKELLVRLRAKLQENQSLETTDLPNPQLLAELASGLSGYTYLSEK